MPGRPSDEWAPTYTVAFASGDLWGDGAEAAVTVAVDLCEHYLEAGAVSDHDHDTTTTTTATTTRTTTRPRSRRARSEFEIRAMALEAALVEAGRTSTDAIDAFVEHLEHRMGPHHGARVVARAWADPAFKERLLADGTAAMAELGIAGAEGDNVRVVENTDGVHNLVVCTLCSCYPWPLLGVPPIWYK